MHGVRAWVLLHIEFCCISAGVLNTDRRWFRCRGHERDPKATVHGRKVRRSARRQASYRKVQKSTHRGSRLGASTTGRAKPAGTRPRAHMPVSLFNRGHACFNSRALGAPGPLCGWLAATAHTNPSSRYYRRQPCGQRVTTP